MHIARASLTQRGGRRFLRSYALENIFAFARLTALNPSINILSSKIRNIYNNEGIAKTAEAEDFKELAIASGWSP